MGSWYYTWSKHKLKSDKEIPDFPHYAIMVCSDYSYTTRGYDRDDPDDQHTVRTFDYYAFPEGEKSQWEKMISDIHKEKLSSKTMLYDNRNENVVFFHSGGRGAVDIKINVSIEHSK